MEGKGQRGRSLEDWFEVPTALRVWFAIHGTVSMLVGLPLFLVPDLLLRALGGSAIDVGASRLVGAALFAIGLASYRTRFASLPVVRAMLGLKLVWAGLGIIALFGAVGAGGPSAAWGLLFAFLVFFGVWTHYAIVFRRIASAGPEAFTYGDPEAPSDDDPGTHEASPPPVDGADQDEGRRGSSASR